MDNAPSPSFFLKHEFLIRRLHSLSGLVPIGGYMCIHLLTNAMVLRGTEAFQKPVDNIHSLPALPLIEWSCIFLPIIFHAVVGVWIVRSGTSNTSNYPLPGNIRYTLQRATAWIALFFIFYHVFQLHGWVPSLTRSLGGARFHHEHATSTAAAALQSSIVVGIVYTVGILACVFHLANGLWSMGITWGVWVSPAGQRRATWLCAAFGIALAVVGLGAQYGMLKVDVDRARAVEDELLKERQSHEARLAEAERSPSAATPAK